MRLAALAIVTGGVLVQQLAWLPPLYLLACPAALFALIGIRYRGPAWRAGCWLLLGCTWWLWHGHAGLRDRLSPEIENRVIDVSGTILSSARHPEGAKTGLSRFVLETEGITAPERIRVAWYDAIVHPVPGDRWQLRLRLKQPMGFSNPGGFDYEAWLFRQGIGATGYVLDSGLNHHLAPPVGKLTLWRGSITARVLSLTRDLEYGAIIRALTIGDRGGLTTRHWNTLNATGTNHLLAISGLHVGLVGLFGFALGRRLWAAAPRLAIRREQAGAGMGLVWALVYAWLSGLGIPAQRALIMVGGTVLAIMGARTVTPGQFLAAALLLVLLADPLAVLDTGLWLSFAAVTAILWAREANRPGLVRGWASIQLAISLGLVPLLALFFQRLSVAAPLINLIAIPIVAAAVVPLCLAGVAALALNEALARGLWLLADRVIHGLWWGLDHAAQLPGVLWSTAAPTPLVLFAALAGVSALLGPLRRTLWVPGSVLLAVALFVGPDRPPMGAARVTMLDVGQGLSVIVETEEHVLVYDAGPSFPSGFDTGSGVVAPYLRSRGLQQVDLLVISHSDTDHRGGMDGLLSSLPVAGVLAAGPDGDCERGKAWRWDQVSFDLLHPPRGMFRGNNGSCVLRVSTRHGSVLLSGDIEKAAEAWLVQHEQRLAAEVLVAPHHGSATSSTDSFLDAVSPRYVLVPAGYGNRFGLPHADVMARYRARGAHVLVSGCEGAVAVELNAGIRVERWRTGGARYWTLQPACRAGYQETANF